MIIAPPRNSWCRAFATLASALALFPAGAIHAQNAADQSADRIPVLAWHGPPADETTLERYRELASAGFTHNYSNFPNSAAMAAALDVALNTGIKQFVAIPELATAPAEVAGRFKNHPALAGYYLADEPGAAAFADLAERARRISAIDPHHPCYINLFPNYAPASALGTPTYRDYLARFTAEVPVPFVSFDHYPVTDAGLRPEWYENLELVAAAARDARKPFWAFALAVAHRPYPIPTIEHLRLQSFSNLAYGAQALQVFTYWTPQPGVWDFHDAPIGLNRQRTAVYDRVRQTNAEVRGLSAVFLGASVRRVGHTGTPPQGTQPYAAAHPVKSLITTGGGALVSLLEKGSRTFLAIVSRELRQPLDLKVDFESGPSVSETRKDGSIHPLRDGTFAKRLEPGDIVVLGW